MENIKRSFGILNKWIKRLNLSRLQSSSSFSIHPIITVARSFWILILTFVFVAIPFLYYFIRWMGVRFVAIGEEIRLPSCGPSGISWHVKFQRAPRQIRSERNFGGPDSEASTNDTSRERPAKLRRRNSSFVSCFDRSYKVPPRCSRRTGANRRVSEEVRVLERKWKSCFLLFRFCYHWKKNLVAGWRQVGPRGAQDIVWARRQMVELSKDPACLLCPPCVIAVVALLVAGCICSTFSIVLVVIADVATTCRVDCCWVEKRWSWRLWDVAQLCVLGTYR